ncbi:enoyl-CoA hydratase/isomerase family protein [Gordonia hirsuta DSM 44140 = NBRC 16056]|uniref:3-hydroxyisobutyryl-CoA hydrolase n=1 Tax=Gordonia hirsuta DSM 44140 = NBRC 16056 TaxID=1121927 RepID=L7LAV5_9ACTN|nr:enoyl-CoA hydratase/isomerase family protein [Gordonia hirsuta]GAC57163.1 enoyl-CoA hydratase/isomerase family protein [Gordonia hirsuta DSM 44140 = NBRC 16056]
MSADPGQDASVIVEVDGRAGRLTLNRPRAINALDHQMVQVMARALDEWEHDPQVQTVVITGAGERGLCAGGDIVAIHRDAAALAGNDDDAAAAATASAEFWRDEYRLNARLADYPKPILAVMDGIVMGGGVGISGHVSHRIATERTRLAMPEVGIGLVPDVGGTWLLSRLDDELGTYAALTSKNLSGADVLALGLATAYVPTQSLPGLLSALAQQPVDEALTAHAEAAPESALAGLAPQIAHAFAGDDIAQIVDRLTGSDVPELDKAATAIAGGSPMALAVTLHALRAARSDRSLRESLHREYRTSLRCLQYPDLAEGIRAKVIDKDGQPQWARTADQISPADVESFTRALPDGLELDLTD